MADSMVEGFPIPGTQVPVAEGGCHTLFIGGRSCDAADGTRFNVEDPATERVLATVANASAVDASLALDAAVNAGAEWAATPSRVRSELLRRAFDQLVLRTDEFARSITAEMGKPLADARAEVGYAADLLRWFAEEAVRVPGRFTAAPDGSTQIVVTGRPVGACYLVTPWNLPLAMATRKLAPALAAGCTTVLKPAELTPLTSLLFTELLVEVGLPIFGPVVVLAPFADERHAVELANATEYGLASYVYTSDVARVHRMIDALDVGMPGVNIGLISNAAAPFGGVNQSGTGREGGTEGLQEYLETSYAAFGGQTRTTITA